MEIEDVHVTSSKRYAKLLEDALERTVLPTSVVPMKRLDDGTGVFARFFDETDLNMPRSWMAGTVISSNEVVAAGLGKEQEGVLPTYTYHVLFDNGDADYELEEECVMENNAWYFHFPATHGHDNP